jgi:hypothetical protein
MDGALLVSQFLDGLNNSEAQQRYLAATAALDGTARCVTLFIHANSYTFVPLPTRLFTEKLYSYVVLFQPYRCVPSFGVQVLQNAKPEVFHGKD